ncbi:hypothetical protein D3C72_1255150 [compost metagenome]
MDRAHQVDVHHQAEIGQIHLGERLVAQDAGVVHQDVDPAPAGHDLGDHGVDRRSVGDGSGVGHGLAARRRDLSNDGLSRRGRFARAVTGAAQVVDHHLGAPRRQGQGVFAAQAAARARHDRHLAVEPNAHPASPLCFKMVLAGLIEGKNGHLC